jgi:hypothetical protein
MADAHTPTALRPSQAHTPLNRDGETFETFPSLSSCSHSNVSISIEASEKHGIRSLTSPAKNWYHRWTTDWWLLELGSLVLATFCLGAIILVLVIHRNSTVPSWPWRVTINSMLSVLSQISNLGLMTGLVGALSQQKWLWFRKSPRPLINFNDFDQATRGPWGSFLLLCSKSKMM